MFLPQEEYRSSDRTANQARMGERTASGGGCWLFSSLSPPGLSRMIFWPAETVAEARSIPPHPAASPTSWPLFLKI